MEGIEKRVDGKEKNNERGERKRNGERGGERDENGRGKKRSKRMGRG